MSGSWTRFQRWQFSLSLKAALVALTVGTAFAQTQKPAIPTHTELNVSTLEGSTRTEATLAVRVTPSSLSEGAAQGSVTFMDGDHSIGSALLDADGEATYTVKALPQGIRNITAIYEGDQAHRGSESEAAAVSSVTSGVPAFTLSAAPSSLSVTVGSTVSTVITATPENGFNQSIALSCSGLPYQSTSCVFTPSSVTPGAPSTSAPNGTAASSTLTIITQAPSGAELQPLPGGPKSKPLYALILPGGLALAGLAGLRKRYFGAVRFFGLTAMLLAAGIGLSSCAARYNYYHKPPSGNPGTPTGIYTVTVTGITGTGSNLTTGSVNLTVAINR